MKLELRDIAARYEDAAAVIRRAFQTNDETPVNYNSAFLASCYSYPGTQPALSPAFFDGDRLVAVLMSVPRHVVFEQKRLNLALLSLNAVQPEYRAYGLGIEIVTEAVRRACMHGYNGAIYYCVDGHPANRTSAAGVKAAGATSHRVFTVEYLIKVLRGMPEEGSNPANPRDFLDAAEPLSRKVTFSRVWSIEEATWQCFGRYGALSESLKTDERRGVVTGYVLETHSGSACLFVEDLLWEELEDEQKKLLLRRLLNRAARSAQIAVVPLWGYTRYDVFRELGFRKSPRRLHVYLSLWNGSNVKSPLGAMYMDAL